jgi:hypothetical protein
MLDSSTPILTHGCKEKSLSVTRRSGSLGTTIEDSGPPNCWSWPKISATACQVFLYLRVSDAVMTGVTARAVPDNVRVT